MDARPETLLLLTVGRRLMDQNGRNPHVPSRLESRPNECRPGKSGTSPLCTLTPSPCRKSHARHGQVLRQVLGRSGRRVMPMRDSAERQNLKSSRMCQKADVKLLAFTQLFKWDAWMAGRKGLFGQVWQVRGLTTRANCTVRSLD